MKPPTTQHSLTVVALLVLPVVGTGVFVYSGFCNIGVNNHHTQPAIALRHG